VGGGGGVWWVLCLCVGLVVVGGRGGGPTRPQLLPFSPTIERHRSQFIVSLSRGTEKRPLHAYPHAHEALHFAKIATITFPRKRRQRQAGGQREGTPLALLTHLKTASHGEGRLESSRSSQNEEKIN